jgi:hypothetical protein
MNRTISRGDSAWPRTIADQRIAHVIDVEIDQRSFRPDDKHAGLALILRMARDVGKERCAGYARHFDDARARGAADEEKNRNDHAYQHALQQSRGQHAHERGHRHRELPLC